MRLEIKPNQDFDDWDSKAVVIINTAEFLRLSLDDTISLIHILGAYIRPDKHMRYAYNTNISAEIYHHMEHIMNTMKVPYVYIGMQHIDDKNVFIALKVYATETLPISPSNRKIISLLKYNSDSQKVIYGLDKNI